MTEARICCGVGDGRGGDLVNAGLVVVVCVLRGINLLGKKLGWNEARREEAGADRDLGE